MAEDDADKEATKDGENENEKESKVDADKEEKKEGDNELEEMAEDDDDKEDRAIVASAVAAAEANR